MSGSGALKIFAPLYKDFLKLPFNLKYKCGCNYFGGECESIIFVFGLCEEEKN